MKKILLLLLFVSTLFAVNDTSSKEIEPTTQEIHLEDLRQEKISKHLKELDRLEAEISKEQVWMKSYSSYLTSLEVRDSLQKMRKRIAYLKKKGRSVEAKDELNSLISKERILVTQVNQLKKKDSALFPNS